MVLLPGFNSWKRSPESLISSDSNGNDFLKPHSDCCFSAYTPSNQHPHPTLFSGVCATDTLLCVATPIHVRFQGQVECLSMKRLILFTSNAVSSLAVLRPTYPSCDNDGKCVLALFIKVGEKFHPIVIFRLLKEIRSYKSVS